MIRQLSVLVENKPGSLMEVTSRLTEAHVNIRAVANFDAPDFGILRMVVDKPEEAKEYLTTRGYVVSVHEVMGVELEDKKGNLNQMLSILAEGKLNINYIYSFVIRDGRGPVMVFQTDDYEKATQILKKYNVKIVEEDDL
ncbi:MAG: amino acid-binding protein [Christensenellales bacterium]